MEEDDITWNVNGNSQQNPWRFGGNKISNQTRTLYSKTAIDDDITKIAVAFGTNSGSITVNSVTLEVYSTASLAAAKGTGDVSSHTISYAASTTRTITVPSGKSWEGRYYCLKMALTVSGSSNKYITVNSITFYKEESSCEKITTAPIVTATTDNQTINLSWTNQTGASSYTVTRTPADGTVGTPSKSGDTWSCAITGLTNGTAYTWTVTPVGDGSTYCASGNTAASASATPNVSRTITYYDKDGRHTTSLADGTNIADALNALYGAGGPTSCDATNYEYFVGWKDGSISGTASSVTLLDDEVVNATNAAKSYYAVWSDTDPDAGDWEVATSIAAGDVLVLCNQACTYELNGISSTSTKYGLLLAVSNTTPTGAYSLTVDDGSSEGTYSFKHGSNYLSWNSGNSLSESSTKNANSSWTVSISNGVATIRNASDNTRYLQYNSGSRFACYQTSSNQANGSLYKYTTVSANYITTCCTSLGSINGSVSWTNSTTAVVEWDKLDDKVSAWALSWSPNTDGSSITSAIADKGETQKTATVSGLACGTEYTFTLTPTIKSGVCALDADPTIVSSYPKPTITLDKVGTTNGDFSISGDLTSQCPGENVTVVLAPNSGYEVDELLIGETDYASVVSNNSYTFEMPFSNVTIHATFKTSVKPEVNVTATEGLTGTTLSYGNVAKETDKALTITVTGSNLTNDVTWALADTDDESAGMFSISPSSTTIGQSAATSGQALEITFTPAAAKTYTATLTFSTTGAAADKVITLTGTGKNLYTVTFKCDGQVFDTKQAFDGETVTFPENPSKFDNDYPNFIGWADAISGIATSAPTLKSASDAITANAEYHAVFSSTPVATGNYAKITTLGELTDGKYVIVGEASSKLAILESEVYSNFYVKGTALTLSEGKVANPAAASVLDFEHSEAGWSINYNATGGGYLVIKDGTGDHINLVPNQESAHYYSAQVTAGGVWTLASTTKTGSQIKYKLYTKNNNEYPEFTVESSDNNPIYLFKQEFTQEFVTRQIVKHTISYNKNTEDEVTGSLPANAIVVDGEDYTVSDATLSRAGYNFIGWNISNTATTAQTTLLNVTEDAILYAVWKQIPTYNIEFSVNGAKVEALKLADQLEGTAIVFPDAAAITAASAFPTTDKKFVGWIEASSYASDDAPTFVTSATATADKVYYAVFADQVSEGGYNKLTSTAGLTAGDKIVVTNGSSVGMKAFGQSSDNNFKGAEIEIEGNQITNLGEACELTLGGTAGHWTLFDGAKYVYAAGSAKSGSGYNNYMKGKDTKDAACEWTISIDGETTTIRSVENTATSYMRYNSSNTSVFSCYNTASQNAVVLFKKAANVYEDYVTNIATLNSIAITTAPKTVYKKGETLDLTGMVVKATYSDSRVRTLSSDKYTIDLADEALAESNNKFTVSYTEGETTKTAEQTIAVYELTSIAVTNEPATTIYLEGATFDKTGMVVKATWGTGEDKIVETLDAEDYTVTPSVLDATSITSVTISYTHEDVTQTTNQAVTVNERPSLTMSWKVGNADPTETKIYEEGGKYLLALPAEDPDPVDAGFTSDFVFKGWTADVTIAKSGENINFAEADDEMSNATTFRAVFAQGEESEVEVFNETFASCDGTGGNDGSWNGTIASTTTPATLTSTWTLQNPNAASACLKLGSGESNASAKTPLIDCGDATSAKLTFKAGAWDNKDDGTTLSLTFTNCSGDKSSVTMVKGAWTSYEVALSNITGNITIQFASTSGSKHRFFLDDVVVTKNVTNYSNYRFAPSNVAAPVIGLTDGTYYGAQNVEITADKAIYYTLDGTNPTNASTPYSNAINLNEAGTKTIKAVAYDSESDDYSAIVSAEYTIVTEIDAPTMPATGKFYEDSKEVTIEHALTAEGAKIYYSYDNAAYSEYSEALTITETKTVWAYATIGSLESEKISATYTKGETVTYTKLTSADQLAAGMEFVLVAEYQEGFYGAGALNSTYLEKVDLTAPVANVLSINDEAVAVFTLDGEPAVWTMSSDAGTLYSNGDKKVNYSNTGNGTWNLTFSENVLTIANNGTGNGNLRYNGSSSRFTTYSGLATVDIYYKEYGTAYSLTYDVDGTENDKTVKVVEGYEYTIVNNVFGDAPEGGIDAYWKDANNNLYTVGDKIILTSNMTLTPVWSQVVRSSLAEGKMGTICPKQEVKYPTGASFYELTYKTIENGVPYKVFFDEIAEGASLVAGKPYLFVADGESITGVKVGDEATEGVNDYNGFHGILNPAQTTLSVTADDAANYKYYIITNNEIRLCGAGTFTIPVERAYIDMSALSAEQVAQSPGRRRVCLTNRAAETVTGVEELNASEAPVKVMIDGLLFIIRGEKMYNANGQVVK